MINLSVLTRGIQPPGNHLEPINCPRSYENRRKEKACCYTYVEKKTRKRVEAR